MYRLVLPRLLMHAIGLVDGSNTPLYVYIYKIDVHAVQGVFELVDL